MMVVFNQGQYLRLTQCAMMSVVGTVAVFKCPVIISGRGRQERVTAHLVVPGVDHLGVTGAGIAEDAADARVSIPNAS